MRLLIQRVKHASVAIGGDVRSRIGAGLLVVGLLVMSRFVWRVEVQGTERLEPEVITAALAEYGVRSGALASGIDARTVERQMQIRFEEIAYIP